MNEHTHATTHSDHDYMTLGHKAFEALVQERVMEILREKHSNDIDNLATHVVTMIEAHIGDMHVES